MKIIKAKPTLKLKEMILEGDIINIAKLEKISKKKELVVRRDRDTEMGTEVIVTMSRGSNNYPIIHKKTYSLERGTNEKEWYLERQKTDIYTPQSHGYESIDKGLKAVGL